MSSTAEAQPERHRVFFALWPDDATRAAISRATRTVVGSSGGRPIAKERLHLTVAFLGELTAEGVDAARAVPPFAIGAAGAFDLVLDLVGVWPESKILWLAPSAPPDALLDLEARLWEGLAERGFQPEERVYRPHVTLARRARPVEAVIEPVRFAVRELALVESLPDGRNVHYEVLERWPLGTD
jgi:2'-5' RNA ligase